MDYFRRNKEVLYAEDVALPVIAEKAGTPFYCYSTATIIRHYNVFKNAFGKKNISVCFAVKSNSNLAILSTLARLGSGADVVSKGEIMLALKAGIESKKIIFSGVGKTREEITYAIKAGIGQFNVESEPELALINEIAGNLGTKASIAIRINPNVDGKTHKKITTGRKQDKFGIDIKEAKDIYGRASNLNNIKIQGIATHIGSQITSIRPFSLAFKKIVSLAKELKAEGYPITRIDFGGGLGIPYSKESPPTPEEYAKLVLDITKGLDMELIFEPGRVIIGNAGILVTRVIYMKKSGKKKFLIVDAGMNDLIRPSFYEAYHEMIPIIKHKAKLVDYDVVGPVCETGDVFAKKRRLPELKEGDLIALRTAGAYGMVMASTYNARLLPAEVLVKGGKFEIVRERENFDSLWQGQTIPEWV